MHRLLNIFRCAEYVRLAWWRWWLPWRVMCTGATISRSVRFLGMPIISLARDSCIEIGDNCVLCSVSEYTALGVNHPVVLRTLQTGAHIRIAADTGISGASICAAISVEIGAHCLLGANVTIADTDFHALASENRRYNTNPVDIACAPVVIEDNVFLGASVIVLKGVTIGRNSVIGAGSVVTRSIPADCIAVGNPARVICQL